MCKSDEVDQAGRMPSSLQGGRRYYVMRRIQGDPVTGVRSAGAADRDPVACGAMMLEQLRDADDVVARELGDLRTIECQALCQLSEVEVAAIRL